ncbi:hypothetical protein BH23GEM9_BH23GEM9_23870 [soil metagenome]
MNARYLHHSRSIVVLALVLNACGESSGTQEPPPTPGITVAAGAAAVDVQPGGAATLNVNVTRTGGYTGAITVAAEGLPAGVTVGQATIGAGQTTAALAINATAAAVPGTTTVTLRGSGTGVSAATTTFALTVTQPPGIQITLNPSALSVQQGSSGNVTVNLTRQGGFTGAVTLTAENLPTGVTIAGATIAAGATNATLTVNAAVAAALATSNVTVRATGTGVTAQTAPLALTVTAVPVPPAIAIVLNPAALSVVQGGSGSVTVNLTRQGGFTGAVTLTAENLPAGVTSAGATIAAGATNATLTVNAAAGATVGAAAVTIRATGTGVTAQTAPLALTVTTAPTGGGNVTFSFCEASATGIPLWFAAQDGTGAWTRVLPNANAEFTFQINATRGGVAYASSDPGTTYLTVFYLSRDEMQAVGPGVCGFPPGATRNVTVNIAGLGMFDQAIVSLGNSTNSTLGATPTVLLEGVAPGLVDLVGSRSSLGGTGFTLNRIFIQRGLNPANNSTLNLDFNGPNSFAPVAANITINNLATDTAYSSVLFQTAGGTLGTIMTIGTGTGNTVAFEGVPSNQMVAGDLHLVTVYASRGAPGTSLRYSQFVLQTMADRTVTLGPELTQPTVTTVATQPYARLRADYTVQADYDTWFFANFGQATPSRSTSIQMSTAYLGGAATAPLEIPALSGVDGWNNAWGPVAGVQVNWVVSATKFSTGNMTTPWADGMSWQSANRTGSITP